VDNPTVEEVPASCRSGARRRKILSMTIHVEPKLPQVLAAALRPGTDAHARQRDLVRASLLCR